MLKIKEIDSPDGYERVVYGSDETTGLKAFIAIHNTALGPALGGCRLYPYTSEQDAMDDAVRLAKGMTYKAAMANLNLGGGKSVIINSPENKSPDLFASFGELVNHLDGKYIVAEDMNTTVEDMKLIHKTTEHVATDSINGSGDPSEMTAYGVFRAMHSALEYQYGVSNMKGIKVAIQGIGKVGYALAEYLKLDGATVYAYDPNKRRLYDSAYRLGLVALENPVDVYDVDADIFAPCALGGILTPENIVRLRAKIICGSANNQMFEPVYSRPVIKTFNKLYVPDYIANAGGLINVSVELDHAVYDVKIARQRTEIVYSNVFHILRESKTTGIPTDIIADIMAQRKLRG